MVEVHTDVDYLVCFDGEFVGIYIDVFQFQVSVVNGRLVLGVKHNTSFIVDEYEPGIVELEVLGGK